MSQENMEIVRAVLDASSRGDYEAFMAALDAGIEWTPVKEDPDFRVHRGLVDVAAWLAEWTEVFPDMRWETERILDAGDDVVVAVVRALGRGDSTGAEVGSQAYAVVFTLRSGKIVRIDESDTGAALKAVGLAEQAMSEESTTPDLVGLTRRQFEAVNRGDMDAVMSRCIPDCVYDTSPDGMGTYEGRTAIRAFLGEWWDAFEELALEPEEVLDLGHGIVISVVCQNARPANSTARVQRSEAYVLEWVGDMIRRVTVYTDIDAGRAAAERLAEERE